MIERSILCVVACSTRVFYVRNCATNTLKQVFYWSSFVTWFLIDVLTIDWGHPSSNKQLLFFQLSSKYLPSSKYFSSVQVNNVVIEASARGVYTCTYLVCVLEKMILWIVAHSTRVFYVKNHAMNALEIILLLVVFCYMVSSWLTWGHPSSKKQVSFFHQSSKHISSSKLSTSSVQVPVEYILCISYDWISFCALLLAVPLFSM